MTKRQHFRGGRYFSSVKEIEESNTTKTKKNAKPKIEPNKSSEVGSGRGESKEKEDINKIGLKLPDLSKVERNVLRYIIGQNRQVRQIITAIYRALQFKTIKSNVLVIGSSGSGKTETIRQVAKRLHIPYTIEDATKYTQEGYYGADVNDMIYNLIENADMDVEKAEHGIIVIDEIDKKARHEDGEHDVAGVEVLKSLLKIIEGTTIKIEDPYEPYDDITIDFDTKNIIIIFLGAFSGLEKIRDKRLNVNPLGFTPTKDISKIGEQKSRYLKSDLVKYGMPEEFVGRIDTIIEMNKLTKQDLTLILKKSELSIFRRYQKELRGKGISLHYDGKLFECIAEESLSLDTGARELSNTVNYMFENIMYDVLANPNKYKQCTLDLDIVHDNTKYELS